jgi:subtilase family serine protease
MPKWLHQAHDMGASSSAQQMNFGILLGMRDQAGAMATLKAISDPSSSSYGQWLTNAEFNARYAPAKSSVTAVQDWLRLCREKGLREALEERDRPFKKLPS